MTGHLHHSPHGQAAAAPAIPDPEDRRRRRTRAAGRAVVAKLADPRQPGLFGAPLPAWIKPCLPTLVDKPPVGPQWVHEIKWEGYRVSVYVEAGVVIIRTRNGHDWTKRFPSIAAAAARLPVRSAVIDGEAVILDDRGRSNFAELQADLDKHGSERAVLYASTCSSRMARCFGRKRLKSVARRWRV